MFSPITFLAQIVAFCIITTIFYYTIIPKFLKVLNQRREKVNSYLQVIQQKDVLLKEAHNQSEVILNKAIKKKKLLIEEAKSKIKNESLSAKQNLLLEKINKSKTLREQLELERKTFKKQLQKLAKEKIMESIQFYFERNLNKSDNEVLIDTIVTSL